MNIWDKTRMLAHIAAWQLRWKKYDRDQPQPDGARPIFITPRQAAALVEDGTTVASTGMAGAGRASSLYWAIRDRYNETGHPKGLTWMAVGAQGGREKIPGTLECLDAPGLITLGSPGTGTRSGRGVAGSMKE